MNHHTGVVKIAGSLVNMVGIDSPENGVQRQMLAEVADLAAVQPIEKPKQTNYSSAR